MTPIERSAEEIIRMAAGSPVSIARVRPDNETKEEWEQVKDILRAYGTIHHYNDKEDSIKFTVNEQGRKLLADGGFEERKRMRELQRMEAEAQISAADSAAKSARSARWANIISLLSLAISVLALIRTYQ